MKLHILKENIKGSKNGYAILFAVVIVSVISMLAIGLSNSTYKQLVLSSLANDSQIAYYQSDTATECALYADTVLGMSSASVSPWDCGVNQKGINFSFDITNPAGGPSDYMLTPTVSGLQIPCFEFNVVKTGASPVATTIYAKGYNSCDKTNQKTVEREIKVTY